MSDDDKTPPPVRWYCVSREGLATLCKNERDAYKTVAGCDKSWPLGGPHRAAQLVDAAEVTAERERLHKKLRLVADRCDDIADHAEPDTCLALRTLAAELRA